MRPMFVHITACLAMLLMLSGCETAGKIVEVIKDPGIQVGEDVAQPSRIAIHAYAAAEVNRNFDDEPSPIIVKVYALSSDHRFYSFDFFSLTEEPEETLGVTLLENVDENMLEPDTYKILGPYEMPKGTRQIAVIAEYLDLESSVWRTSYKVADIGSNDRLLLLLLEEEARLISQNE